jgi:hypothetical protein
MKPKKLPSAVAKAAIMKSVDKAMGHNRKAHGPEPERLKITGDWKAAVGLALRKPRPKSGWPK